MLSDHDVERIADAVALRFGLVTTSRPVAAQTTAERLIQLASNPETRELSKQLAKEHSKACRTKRGVRA